MKEEFLHYLWRFRLLQPLLFTTKSESVEVVKPGLLNTDAGPDFLQAKVKIGETLWAGNIEIHVLASDWNKHRHQNDKAYNTTVLHVVYACDKDIYLENGEIIPCLELKGKFDQTLLDKYEGFLKSKQWIPCSGQICDFPKLKLSALYSRMSIERLEDKTELIGSRLGKNKNNWEETFYQVLAGGFGLKVNQDIFIRLAESLPLNTVLRQQNNSFQIEALLFGQAGFLHEKSFVEDYPIALKKEYAYLSKKYRLQHLPSHLWKYLRLRPSNFPTLRIAQLAILLSKHQKLFSKVIESETLEQLISLFKVEASPYWETHFVFDKTTNARAKVLSNERINLLLINVIIPFMFLFGKQRSQEHLVERALNFLDLIPAEKNKPIKNFENEGLEIATAFQTQALIQLKSNYCDLKKCLDCPVGLYLLR
jgi:hypothetical protein